MLIIYLSALDTQEEKDRFTVIYECCKERMYRTALGILKDDQKAQDAVHEAFLYLAEHFDALPTEHKYKIGAYLYRSTRNYALKILEAEKKTPEDIDPQWPDDAPGMEDRLVSTESLSRMMAALREMPDRYRLPLEYRFLEHKSVQEIAECMNISEDAAYKRIERGCNQLWKKLKEVD